MFGMKKLDGRGITKIMARNKKQLEEVFEGFHNSDLERSRSRGQIYKITNLLNGKLYIGRTMRSVDRRWREHVKDAGSRIRCISPLHRAINKYGESNFSVEILVQCLDSQAFDFWEKFYIENLNTLSPAGYNLTSGGDGLYGLSEETRQKISASSTGRVFSSEHRRKIGESNKGKKKFQGHTHSIESKLKIAEANRGREFSLEHRKNLSISHLGAVLSEQHKRKIGNACRGFRHSAESIRKISEWRKGRKLSAETRSKISETKKRLHAARLT